MKDYSNTIEPGIMLGKENGLTLMLDAEVYDYAFSPQRGEGFKVRRGGGEEGRGSVVYVVPMTTEFPLAALNFQFNQSNELNEETCEL